MVTRVIIKGCYHSKTSLFPEIVTKGVMCTARGSVIGFFWGVGGWWTVQSQGHCVARWFEIALYCSSSFLVTSASVDAVT